MMPIHFSMDRRNSLLASIAHALVSLLGLTSAVLVTPAWGGIPTAYKPLRISAPFSFAERTFNLTAALEEARRLDKPLFVYFGSDECPPCKEYSLFLARNVQTLSPLFERFILVDLSTSLRGPPIYFLVDGSRLRVQDFKRMIGDRRGALSYPTFWLIDGQGNQLRQLPDGVEHYTSPQQLRRTLGID